MIRADASGAPSAQHTKTWSSSKLCNAAPSAVCFVDHYFSALELPPPTRCQLWDTSTNERIMRHRVACRQLIRTLGIARSSASAPQAPLKANDQLNDPWTVGQANEFTGQGVAQNDEKGGGYSTRPTTPTNAPGNSSRAIHDSPPPNRDDSSSASFAENPNRG